MWCQVEQMQVWNTASKICLPLIYPWFLRNICIVYYMYVYEIVLETYVRNLDNGHHYGLGQGQGGDAEVFLTITRESFS